MSSELASDTPLVTPTRSNGTSMSGEWAFIMDAKQDKLRQMGVLGGKRTIAIFCHGCRNHFIRKSVPLDRALTVAAEVRFKHCKVSYCDITHVWK